MVDPATLQAKAGARSLNIAAKFIAGDLHSGLAAIREPDDPGQIRWLAIQAENW